MRLHGFGQVHFPLFDDGREQLHAFRVSRIEVHAEEFGNARRMRIGLIDSQ